MTITHRRLIYAFFICVFVVVGPLITLYATGYRYNTKLGVVQQTGAIILEIDPRDVSVYVDGVLLDNFDTVDNESIRLTRLIPKEYRIKISKNGYYDWRAMADIDPSETVFFQNIQMFKKDIFPIYVTDLEMSDLVPPVSYSTSTSLSFSDDSKVFVRPGKLDDYVVYSHGEDLEDEIIGIVPKSEFLFYEDVSYDWIMLHDIKSRTLYFYHKDRTGEINRKFVMPNVVNFDWSPDGRYVAYNNNFEIWVLDTVSGSQKLVTRRSSGIGQVIWHSSGSHLIYLANDNIIRIQEISDRQEPALYDIIDLPDATEIRINNDGSVLYVNAKIGKQSGWFGLNIQ